jgi:hypothetical protein
VGSGAHRRRAQTELVACNCLSCQEAAWFLTFNALTQDAGFVFLPTALTQDLPFYNPLSGKCPKKTIKIQTKINSKKR